jgi:hypothetical protein
MGDRVLLNRKSAEKNKVLCRCDSSQKRWMFLQTKMMELVRASSVNARVQAVARLNVTDYCPSGVRGFPTLHEDADEVRRRHFMPARITLYRPV